MKTIENMAKEYSAAYPANSTEQYIVERAYMRGANDVLGEIMVLINSTYPNNENLAAQIKNKIAQLRIEKGE